MNEPNPKLYADTARGAVCLKHKVFILKFIPDEFLLNNKEHRKGTPLRWLINIFYYTLCFLGAF